MQLGLASSWSENATIKGTTTEDSGMDEYDAAFSIDAQHFKVGTLDFTPVF